MNRLPSPDNALDQVCGGFFFCFIISCLSLLFPSRFFPLLFPSPVSLSFFPLLFPSPFSLSFFPLPFPSPFSLSFFPFLFSVLLFPFPFSRFLFPFPCSLFPFNKVRTTTFHLPDS